MEISVLQLVVLLVVFFGCCELVWTLYRRRSDRVYDRRWTQMEENIAAFVADQERELRVQDAMNQAFSERGRLEQICLMAAQSLRVHGAMVSVVSASGQTWVASYGSDGYEEIVKPGTRTPLSASFCKFVVASGEVFAVKDTLRDKRVVNVDLAVRQIARSYLGVPIRSSDQKTILGTLCAFDSMPRRWTQKEISTITSYASLVSLL